jgi:hypothetical protein
LESIDRLGQQFRGLLRFGNRRFFFAKVSQQNKEALAQAQKEDSASAAMQLKFPKPAAPKP